MKIVEIIKSKVWYNKRTGQQVSIYGAVPWTNPADKNDWEIEVVGYTWRLDNGTVGLGRPAASSIEDAERIMNSFNNGAR